MTTSIQERLRKVCLEIRRKPYPLSDLIPLLLEAVDYIDGLEQKHEQSYWDGVTEISEKYGNSD